MKFFSDLFPAIAEKETLSVGVGKESTPDGVYSFYESFCDNLNCRCTTVALSIIFTKPNNRGKFEQIATMDYDWCKPISNKNPYYHVDELQSKEKTQTDMAKEAMLVFRHALKLDGSYSKKLDNHFEMVRDYIRIEMQGTPKIKENNILRLGRNAPCHCGSNKKYKKCCLKK